MAIDLQRSDLCLHFLAHRLAPVVADATLSDRALREWLDAFAEDLQTFAETDFPLSDAERDAVTRHAEAVHRWVFHGGPEPET